MAASFPAVTSSVAGGGGMSAPARVVSLAGLRCGSRAGNSVHEHLWVRRVLGPSFACHKLQPRRAAIVFNATRVVANLLPARPLVVGGLESQGHSFPRSDDGRRLDSRINRKGRPAKRASHDRVN
jgi:hypothetical protein